jgi:hypothetical protein
MLRVYHLIIGAILLVSIPVGARFLLPNFFANKGTPSNTVATPTKTATPASTPSQQSSANKVNVWQNLLGSTSAPSNWQVIPCQGEANLLCVSSQGKGLGTVEVEISPVKSNPDFQKHLTEVGISQSSPADLQNPQFQSKLIKSLQAWVADSYNNFAKDHQTKYANNIAFSSYPPQQATVGKLPGMRYGFVRLKPDGGIQEQYIAYVTSNGTQLYVITTSFNSNLSQGRFESLENLAIFQPYLSAIAENLNLPTR